MLRRAVQDPRHDSRMIFHAALDFEGRAATALPLSYEPARDDADVFFQQNMAEFGKPFADEAEARRFFKTKFAEVGIKIGELSEEDLEEAMNGFDAGLAAGGQLCSARASPDELRAAGSVNENARAIPREKMDRSKSGK